MKRSRWIIAIAITIAFASTGAWIAIRQRPAPATTASSYADPQSCVRCHRDETAGYNETGMAHAFYAPTAAVTTEAPLAPATERTYFHPASSTYFTLTAHDGRFFQRRWQKGFDGREDNVVELSIDAVMGSGHKARTFLHRRQDGTLIELPLAWYAERGGTLAMNPGFDNAAPMTQRVVAYECMFCHNGFSQIPDPAHRDLSAKPIYTSLPMGIDCQRCHGPGAAHVAAAEARRPDPARVHATILNPAHLSADRQMQVCEQCHLEATSTLLPDRIRRYNRSPFDYDPREPLPAFNAYFTRSAPTQDVEIVSSVFRLRQSRCFLESQGALTCETCHNPHDLHRGPQSAAFFANICLNCHAAQLRTLVAAKRHTDSNQCVTCHMPQVRTSDVIHATITDHLIQRRAPTPAVALAPRQEATSRYHGPVVRYLLDGETPAPTDELYNAVAQVIDQSNLEQGTPALAKLLEERHPDQPAFFLELGDAERHLGHSDAAIAAYREALALDPLSSRAARRLGVGLGASGQLTEASRVLQDALAHDPANEYLLYELAQVDARSGDSTRAIVHLGQALAIRPDYPDALNNLGALLAESGNAAEAEQNLRSAIAADPYSADARANLARLLRTKGISVEADFQLDQAIRLEPSSPRPHLDRAIGLLTAGKLAEAEAEAATALRLAPTSASALDLDGQIQLAKNQPRRALERFQAAAAADPSFAPATLDVAETLLELRQPQAARVWLQKAASSSSPAVRSRAQELLRQLSPAN